MKFIFQIQGFSFQAGHDQAKPEEHRLLLLEVIGECLKRSTDKNHESGKEWISLKCFKTFLPRVDDIGKSIVAAAKEIVIKQRISLKDDEKGENGFQLTVDSRLQSLEDKIEGLENKIDRILSAVTTRAGHRWWLAASWWLEIILWFLYFSDVQYYFESFIQLMFNYFIFQC